MIIYIVLDYRVDTVTKFKQKQDINIQMLIMMRIRYKQIAWTHSQLFTFTSNALYLKWTLFLEMLKHQTLCLRKNKAAKGIQRNSEVNTDVDVTK